MSEMSLANGGSSAIIRHSVPSREVLGLQGTITNRFDWSKVVTEHYTLFADNSFVS